MGYGSYVVYKGIDKVPYVSKIFDGNKTIEDYSGPVKAASSFMVQNEIPLWGEIISAPVPSAGTKEVVVYISDTGNDYDWHNRIRFVISPDNSVQYSTRYVD